MLNVCSPHWTIPYKGRAYIYLSYFYISNTWYRIILEYLKLLFKDGIQRKGHLTQN